ncbi:MAG: hypothetical protein JWQ74_2733 [Marmoricola sp.]|nr:hypothetical protein [Marmoricola sp.]
MDGNSSGQRRNRRGGIALAVVLLVLAALSPAFGRADPQSGFRPALPPDALTNGCYPLPDGLRFTFPYQVRTDGDTVSLDGRKVRTLFVQYDDLDEARARAALTADFARAGFRSLASAPTTRNLTFSRIDTGLVGAAFVPLSAPHDDGIVRGTIVLTLPRVAVASTAEVCSDPNSTKRFPPGEPTLGTLP